MKIDYCIVNPTGNITMLVTTDVPVEKQAAVSKMLFDAEKTVEQIGFISDYDFVNNTVNIRMSGGEFCGNAAISSAAFSANKNSIDNKTITVSFAECNIKVDVAIRKTNENGYCGTVEMPTPETVSEIEYSIDGKKFLLPTVRYNSISHIICDMEFEKSFSEKAIKKWCDDIGEKALGIMFLNHNSLRPLVYVKESDALYWEGSCASGTSAVGEYLFFKNGNAVDRSFNEPKGILSVKIENDKNLCLTGSAVIESYNTLDINL